MEARAQITTEELERLKTQPEVLVAIIREQARLIEKLREQNGKLDARVRELEEQNRPPCAPFRRKRPEGQAKQPGKPGRRKGHKAEWKKKPGVIDEHVEVSLEPECPCCAMLEHEQRGLPYLFKLRHTARVRELVAYMMRQGARWRDCGEGWSAMETTLRLGGWPRWAGKRKAGGAAA